ncbi:MAG TPA: hypothetical protein LFW10_04920 [Rickettsia endosymbiont of Diachasma alloeum]|nr:hypothetical protein [Rickettsia endosymbiont of Diachasma alloeum]
MTIFHFVISGWQNIECKSLIQRANWVEMLKLAKAGASELFKLQNQVLLNLQ